MKFVSIILSYLLLTVVCKAQQVDCVCEGIYEVGDTVVATVDSPSGATGVMAGDTGVVVCGQATFPDTPLMVAWDGWNGGHDNVNFCECGDGGSTDGSNGWYVTCENIEYFQTTVWTVDDDGVDFPKAHFDNIQDAVDAASNGDEIIVYPGMYYGSGTEVVDMLGKEVWLHSNGPVVTIDGGTARRCIVCDSGETSKTIIEGFTFAQGFVLNLSSASGGSGAYIVESSPTFVDCTFEYCVSEGYFPTGGAVYCERSFSTFTSCEFMFNEANGQWAAYGGALSSVEEGNLTLVGCDFYSNVAVVVDDPIGWDFQAVGGAIYCENDMTITECDFGLKMFGNIAMSGSWAQGGAIGFFKPTNTSANLHVSDCNFRYNTVWGSQDGTQDLLEGGAIRILGMVDTIISNSYFLNNGNSSGSVGITGSPLTISGDVIIEDHGISGLDVLGPGSSIDIVQGARLLVQGDVRLDEGGVLNVDIITQSAPPPLDLTKGYSNDEWGILYRYGGIQVTNESGTLSSAQIGAVYAISVCELGGAGFDSVVFPTMPSGLGLELQELPDTEIGDGDSINVIVVEVDEASFENPIPENLSGVPVELLAFDADGDGKDEIAILFEGQPGFVTLYSVSTSGAPTEIVGTTVLVGNNPVDLDTADFDSDGREDLVVANSTDNAISLLLSKETNGGEIYLDQSTISIPGAHTLTTLAAMMWNGNEYADLAVGLDLLSTSQEDAYHVITDIGTSPTSGPTYEIPKYVLPDLTLTPDPPTEMAGGNTDLTWGFVAGTRRGQIHYVSELGGIRLLGKLNGNRIVKMLLQDLDAAGGDGQLDILVASDEAESIYLLNGDNAQADNFGDLIALGVGSQIEDVIALDADVDGDTDFIFTAPNSKTPLVLLRNDGIINGLLPNGLSGISWGRQNMNSGNCPTKIAGGTISPKGEDEDWVIGVGGCLGLRGDPIGSMEQTNLLLASTCQADIDGDGEVDVIDLLEVIAAWGPCDSCPEDFDGDGEVDVADILILIAAWGPCGR